jgi:hypothetical protein
MTKVIDLDSIEDCANGKEAGEILYGLFEALNTYVSEILNKSNHCEISLNSPLLSPNELKIK